MNSNLSDAARFGLTLNKELNGMSNVYTDTKQIEMINPAAFPRLATLMPDNVKMNITDIAAESGLPIVTPVEEYQDDEVVNEAVQIISETVANPTREAYSKAMNALERLTEQSIISNAEAYTLNRAINKATKPNHYGNNKKRPQKLSKPSNFFGNSKDVVLVEDRGVIKKMTLKTAKKKGFI